MNELQQVSAVLDIEPVWSAHRVGFGLLTARGRQYAAYYDAQRRMSVAQRTLGRREWTITRLDSVLNWDSHNYVTLAMDDEGFLHVSGNMHCDPLVYFRGEVPLEASSLRRVEHMVDPARERRVTYPRFLRGPRGRLLFGYRDGESGCGDDYYNVYDLASRRWLELVDRPLMTGHMKMNGYFSSPQAGPDGRFHIQGVWREYADAEANHDLSYARTEDLLHWEAADGREIPLPLDLDHIDVADPVPVKGGLANGNTVLGFDSANRPLIAYHKYDADGTMQLFAARFEDGRWVVRRVSEWAGYRWHYHGLGSLEYEVRVGQWGRDTGGRLTLGFRYPRQEGYYVFDEATLAVIETVETSFNPLPAGLRQVESDFPGMQRHWAPQYGADGQFLLAWEALGPKNDRPRSGLLPEPSMLRLIELAD